MNQILNPLKEKIRDFEKKVEDSYLNEKTERNMLRGELNKLIELNKVMTQEAEQLTKALKGENKTQGNWGEMLLENILEKSGLRRDEEYVLQETYRSEDGQMLRPDVVVKLPGNKVLIVDSKMTLTAYEAYSSAPNSEIQDHHAKLHVDSLKRHIDGLSEKKYHLAENIVTPDFVILFMPLEPAFALAFKYKPDLFQYAWDRNVAIVSPTTLLTTLRTVSVLWRQDRQEKNAFEIARRAGHLYDKFVGLIKDFSLLGDKVQSAYLHHEEVMKKLSSGRGNLMDQVEELKRLGAKTDKALPQLEK
ncbi:MAG: DNA recombination protein RmuC [Pseudobdellovibrionaceae bacterium]